MSLMSLVNQGNASSNGVTSCTLTMAGCTPGNTLILAYAVRGDGNDPRLTDGWLKLGGGNNVDVSDSLQQRLYFAYKVVSSETETVTLNQATTGRIYLVCAEVAGVHSIRMRDDLASKSATAYTVAGAKTSKDDVMLYAVTSAYYDSGQNQTVSPADLEKVYGDTSAERLACWFDNGTGALEHSFKTTNLTDDKPAILECVQLLPLPAYYLIRSGSILYTIVDGALSALTETELAADLFQTYGVDDLPDGSLLVGLTDPEVLYWHDSTDDPPELTMTVAGSPPVPQIVVTNAQDMSDPSILGIESATVDASDDVLFAISFDDGVTWKAYDGAKWVTLSAENSGMTKTTMENISLESWAEVAMSAMYKLRFVLMNAGSYVAAVRMNYIN